MERKQEDLDPIGKGSGHNNPLRSLIYHLFYKGGAVYRHKRVKGCFHVKIKEAKHGGRASTLGKP